MKKDKHKKRTQLGLCRRAYENVRRYHPMFFDDLVAAVNDGVEPAEIATWAKEIVPDEARVWQQVRNAAIWAKEVGE